MKALCVAVMLIFSIFSVNAIACPKGTHPVGGSGKHHKGEICK